VTDLEGLLSALAVALERHGEQVRGYRVAVRTAGTGSYQDLDEAGPVDVDDRHRTVYLRCAPMR
jgi:ABC-type tungstate transport system permease subunit